MISVEKQANLEQRNIRFSTDPGLDAKVTKIAMAPNIYVQYYHGTIYIHTVQYIPYVLYVTYCTTVHHTDQLITKVKHKSYIHLHVMNSQKILR